MCRFFVCLFNANDLSLFTLHPTRVHVDIVLNTMWRRKKTSFWSTINQISQLSNTHFSFPTISLLFFYYRPDLTVKKRRGGQRMRRLKGRYEETTLMKQANTRAFSVQTGEYGDDAMGRTLGLLEMSTGSVGATTTEHSSIRKQIEVKKMKYANTRASRKKAAQMNRHGLPVTSNIRTSLNGNNNNLNNPTTSSGLVSSMVFTPIQGMELVNPDAMKDRVKEANHKWFHDHAGFQSAITKNK
jgi:U4/U6 small nuclear ribonucleoprotein PRP31